MFKMHYLSRPNKFSKTPSAGALRFCPQHPLTFDIDDLKVRDLAKLRFF